MEKINVLALGSSLSREEMRNIKGGVVEEEAGWPWGDKGTCTDFSYYCSGIKGRKSSDVKWSNSWGCCDPE